MEKLRLFFRKDNKDNKEENKINKTNNVVKAKFNREDSLATKQDISDYIAKKLKVKKVYLSWYNKLSLELFETALNDGIELDKVAPHYDSYEVLEELINKGGERYELGLYYALASSDLEDLTMVYSASDVLRARYFHPISYSMDREELEKTTKEIVKPDKGVDVFLSKKPLLSIHLSDGYSLDYYKKENVFVESRKKIYKDLFELIKESPRGSYNIINLIILALARNDVTAKEKLTHSGITPRSYANKFYDAYINRKKVTDNLGYHSDLLDVYVSKVPLVLVCKDLLNCLNTIKSSEVELYETSVKDIAERYDLFEYFKNEKMDTENISKALLEIAERVEGRNIPTKDTCYKIINKYSKRKNIK